MVGSGVGVVCVAGLVDTRGWVRQRPWASSPSPPQHCSYAPAPLQLPHVGPAPGDESGPHQQEIAVWEWTADREGPVCACAMPTPDLQTCVRVNPHDTRQLVTNGQDRVVFWSWEEGKVRAGPQAAGLATADTP
jgi:hypothetical protein